MAGARGTTCQRSHALPQLCDDRGGPVGRRDERQTHFTLVLDGQRRTRTWRPLPVGRQCGRRHSSVRTAVALLAHVGDSQATSVGWRFAFRPMAAGRTKLMLTHTAHLSAHWDEYGPGAAGVGWELTLLGLAIHVARSSAAMPDEVRFFHFACGKGVHRGQQRRMGEGVGRGRNAAGGRRRGGQAHDRVLHRRICRACLRVGRGWTSTLRYS